METKEQIKEHLRAMTAEQIEAQEMECQKILFYYAGVTADDRAEARLILQAIEELERESEQQHLENEQAAEEIATALEQAGREIVDERQARIMARALQLNEERTAAAQEPQQISRSAKCEATRANLRPMTAEARAYLSKWCKPNKIAVFYQEAAAIYNDLVAGSDDKAVARRIYAQYKDMRTQIIDDSGKPEKRPDWKTYLKACADAYGVILHPYKPSQLE